MAKRRALLVGLGSRATMYRDATALKYPDTVELVGICDSNAGRLLMAQSWLKSHGLTVPGCPPEGFEKLIQDQRADLVIVVSRDCTHDDYIVRGLRCGCDIITEKPMTTTAEKCQRIVDTIKETGRNVRVTFNYRYSPNSGPRLKSFSKTESSGAFSPLSSSGCSTQVMERITSVAGTVIRSTAGG